MRWDSLFLSHKGTRSIETLRFGSNFAVWQWTPVLGDDTQEFLCNTQCYFQFLHYEFISVTKTLFGKSFTAAQLVAR
jgi:hypothetical protein